MSLDELKALIKGKSLQSGIKISGRKISKIAKILIELRDKTAEPVSSMAETVKLAQEAFWTELSGLLNQIQPYFILSDSIDAPKTVALNKANLRGNGSIDNSS